MKVSYDKISYEKIDGGLDARSRGSGRSSEDHFEGRLRADAEAAHASIRE
jgi:hypothetical protein